ncbi:MAG: polysaccharide biosynthesis/export family protein [Candidatus Omnitrophica bacterium]|nr:polysaccharide biosynthesis/export family protein [Candidatus Omnitrophota bacterium]MBU4478675.1 polysaccharide biosynthesis/export family protein [Candidatus Omnitrophota bacterium]
MRYKVSLGFMLCLIAGILLWCRPITAGQDEADTYYQQGLILYQQGNYSEAEKKFQQAISAAKDKKEVHYQKGLQLYGEKKYNEAEQEFEQAIIKTERESDQYYKNGLVLYNQGRYREAQEEFQKAISIIKQGRKQQAVQDKDTEKNIPQAAEVSALPVRKDSAEYLIGRGDSLMVKVWQNPDLNDELIVRPDGMISFPLVGDMPAAGLTVREFNAHLTQSLKEYIRNPQVSVAVKNISGKRVIVLGQVRSPGIYSVTGRKTILEAVGLAGGFTEDAVISSIMLVKGGFEKPVPKRLDLTKALKKADVSDDAVLETEDIIYVPRRFIKDVNYFLKLFLEPVSHGLFIKREFRDF